MTTAAAITDGSGRMMTVASDCKIGLSGHGGSSKSCLSGFDLGPVFGWNAHFIDDINSINPAAHKEMLKVFDGKTKVRHQNAYILKTNKKGDKVKSSLGHYITAKSKENKISVLINGFSYMCFVENKRVTYLWAGLK